VVDGFRTPAGMIIAISPYTGYQHSQFLERSHNFCPECFAGWRSVPCHRYACMPYGAGQRKCIGHPMALIEAQWIIAMLARSFLSPLSSPSL